jgi:hypothetical protein
MTTTPSFVQVAADGSGKKVRNFQNDVAANDGTVNTVQQQVVTIASEDGTVLSTSSFVETERDKYMRRLAEDTLQAINRSNELLVAILNGRTSPYSERF